MNELGPGNNFWKFYNFRNQKLEHLSKVDFRKWVQIPSDASRIIRFELDAQRNDISKCVATIVLTKVIIKFHELEVQRCLKHAGMPGVACCRKESVQLAVVFKISISR